MKTKIYKYFINLNERGSFYADVRDEKGKTVYEVRGGNELPEDETSLVEDGYMKNFTDAYGLQEYLKEIGVIKENAVIIHA